MGMFLMVFLIGLGKNQGHAGQRVLAPLLSVDETTMALGKTD
jgi:hypothetical protein